MPERKQRPLEEHSDAEVLTLIAWGYARIAAIDAERAEIEADIKKWRKEVTRRRTTSKSSSPAVRRVLMPPSHLKTTVPRRQIREAVRKVVRESSKKG